VAGSDAGLLPAGRRERGPGAPRLPVKLRLLGIFLLISVIPLATLGTLAYNTAHALLRADPARAASLVGRRETRAGLIRTRGVLSVR